MASPTDPASPATTSEAVPPESVCVIGASGALGFGLAVRLGVAGVPVVIGSRDEQRARDTAARAADAAAGGAFSGFENATAVTHARTVILSVPFASQAETIANVKQALQPDQLLIDATVPLATATGGRPTRLVGVWQGSAAQQALELAPDGVRVVSALHTVSAAALADLRAPLHEDVLICGDRRADKREAAALLQRIEGLRCVDCGRLEMARITESLTALLISINGRYKAHAGITLTGLPGELWE